MTMDKFIMVSLVLGNHRKIIVILSINL